MMFPHQASTKSNQRLSKDLNIRCTRNVNTRSREQSGQANMKLQRNSKKELQLVKDSERNFLKMFQPQVNTRLSLKSRMVLSIRSTKREIRRLKEQLDLASMKLLRNKLKE
jgi:hypothetical protein